MLAPIHLIGSMHMAKVLVPLATGCEELEAVTVIDLLRRASIEVVSAGLGARGEAVRASRGTVLIPDSSLDGALARARHRHGLRAHLDRAPRWKTKARRSGTRLGETSALIHPSGRCI